MTTHRPMTSLLLTIVSGRPSVANTWTSLLPNGGPGEGRGGEANLALDEHATGLVLQLGGPREPGAGEEEAAVGDAPQLVHPHYVRKLLQRPFIVSKRTRPGA